MSKWTWDSIAAELKKQKIALPRDKESFWQEFNARASQVEQEVPKHYSPGLMLLKNRWTKVAALLTLTALGWILVHNDSKNIPVVGNKVKKIEVFASYSAMIILDDDQHRGTIVWVADLGSAQP